MERNTIKIITDFTYDFKRAFSLIIEEKIDLTYPQWRVLKAIKHSQNDITAIEIAEILNADKVTISGIVNRLEVKSFLVKKKSPHDKRKFFLEISPQAENLCKSVMAIEETFTDCLFQSFTKEEISIYIDLTLKLTKNLDSINIHI